MNNNMESPKTYLPFFIDLTEDEILERKLFFEGGPSFDDTSINKLIRTISKFCCEPDKLKIEAKKDGIPPMIPTVEEQYEELSKSIEACRSAAVKSSKVLTVCSREFDLFMEAIRGEEYLVKVSQREVSEAALDLEYEKKMLSIRGFSAAGETESQLAELEKWRAECQLKIERRKKQFETLADVAKRLESLLKDDDDDATADLKPKHKKEISEEPMTIVEIS